MQVVAVLMLIRFSAFPGLTCHIEDIRIGVFLLHCAA